MSWPVFWALVARIDRFHARRLADQITASRLGMVEPTPETENAIQQLEVIAYPGSTIVKP